MSMDLRIPTGCDVQPVGCLSRTALGGKCVKQNPLLIAKADTDAELATQTIIDLEIEIRRAAAKGVGNARRRRVEHIVDRAIQIDALAPIVRQAQIRIGD